MHRAGELTSLWMPDANHEAVRELVRAREAVMYWRNKARQALSGFLLRKRLPLWRPKRLDGGVLALAGDDPA